MKLVCGILDETSCYFSEGAIPDAATIHAIRKRRQMARENDFIPLDETEKFETEKSRLIRYDTLTRIGVIFRSL